MVPPTSPADVNAMDEASFIEKFGPLFENTPWIVRVTWASRPFGSRQDLLEKLLGTVRASSFQEKLDLIKAHPDLAGRLAASGGLTDASKQEQAAAGLDRLSPAEAERFTLYNDQYKAKFGFPFVICARLADKEKILEAFPRRLALSLPEEAQTALGEIEKIAALRLDQIMPA